MSRPQITVPGTAETIRRQREEQEAYDRDPVGYEKHRKEWSLDECRKLGCLPTGEPLEAIFGVGDWTEEK